jgi:hypothetical protein
MLNIATAYRIPEPMTLGQCVAKLKTARDTAAKADADYGRLDGLAREQALCRYNLAMEEVAGLETMVGPYAAD